MMERKSYHKSATHPQLTLWVAVWWRKDKWGQLVRENDARADRTYVYNYDLFGNPLTKKAYGYSVYALGAELVDERDTYTYNDPNAIWDDLLTEFNGAQINYDEIGNPLNYLGWNMTWQAGRQLASMSKPGTSISFKYDDDGIRTSKIVNGVTTSYTTIDGRITSQKTGVDLIYFYYDCDNNLLGFNNNGVDYVYVKNLQGDIIGIVNQSGVLVVEYSYDAWGNEIEVTGNTALAEANPFRYRGYYWDSETNFYYCQSRYYNPEVKRWLNADDAALLETLMSIDEILGANLFIYCNNNVVMNYDPTGHLSINFKIPTLQTIIAGAIIGGILGTLLEIALQMIFEKKTFDKLDWKRIAIEFASGALTGALIACNFPVKTTALGRGIIGATSSLAHSIRQGKFKTVSGALTSVGIAGLVFVATVLLGKLGKKAGNTHTYTTIYNMVREVLFNRLARSGIRIGSTLAIPIAVPFTNRVLMWVRLQIS